MPEIVNSKLAKIENLFMTFVDMLREFHDELTINDCKYISKTLRRIANSVDGKFETPKRYQSVKWSNQRKVKCLENSKIYNSVREAARDTGCHPSSIIDCCKGRSGKTKNLHWEYAE